MREGTRDKLESAISALEAEAYQRGLERGLQIAERIAGWLTWQPQSKRMAEIEKWTRNAIAEECELIPAGVNTELQLPTVTDDRKADRVQTSAQQAVSEMLSENGYVDTLHLGC